MSNSETTIKVLEDSFDELRYTFTKLTEDYEHLKSYNNVLKVILGYYKITYPDFNAPGDLDF
jgi:hypothetical protein